MNKYFIRSCIFITILAENMSEAEVSLDAVLNKKLSLSNDITDVLDNLLSETIEKFRENENVPAELVLLSRIHAGLSTIINTQKCSVVDCFNYLYFNLEKILSGMLAVSTFYQ